MSLVSIYKFFIILTIKNRINFNYKNYNNFNLYFYEKIASFFDVFLEYQYNKKINN